MADQTAHEHARLQDETAGPLLKDASIHNARVGGGYDARPLGPSSLPDPDSRIRGGFGHPPVRDDSGDGGSE